MASLRDQLVAKGLASKKRAKQIGREAKKNRKKAQGHRKRKGQLRREQQTEQERAAAIALAARRKRRLERTEAREQVERALQIRNLLLGNALRARGRQRFWHHSLDRKHLLRMELPLKLAEQLRRGELAIAGIHQGVRVDYLIIPKRVALKLRGLGADVLVFFVEDPKGISEPELRFHEPCGEPSLRPHKVSLAQAKAARSPA